MAIGTSYNNISTCYFHSFILLSSLSLSQLVECDIVNLNYILLMRHDVERSMRGVSRSVCVSVPFAHATASRNSIILIHLYDF